MVPLVCAGVGPLLRSALGASGVAFPTEARHSFTSTPLLGGMYAGGSWPSDPVVILEEMLLQGSEVDIWPLVRRHIDEIYEQEKEVCIFPSIVFQRFDKLLLKLKDTFDGLDEVTSQVARYLRFGDL